MFTTCDFLMGKDQSIVIVIPAHLPKADTYTISVTDRNITFKADYKNVAEILYENSEVYKRISGHTQIGLVEYPPYGKFPDCITQVAYVELRRAV